MIEFCDLNYKKLLFINSIYGVFLLSLLYNILNFNNKLFWISMLLILIPLFLIIFSENCSDLDKLSVLIFLAFIMYLIRLLPSPSNFHFGDELIHLETTNLIFENKNLDISPYFEVSKYYPAMELVVIIGKYLTDLEIFFISKIIIGFTHLLISVFIYFFFVNISLSKQIAAIGTCIYLLNPMYIFFHSLFSYESLGIFFSIMILYLVSNSLNIFRIQNRILFLIVLATLVISHHLSSYMLILFMIILILYKILSNWNFSGIYLHLINLLILATSVFGWIIYMATVSLRYSAGTFIERFSKIIELTLIFSEKISMIPNSLTNSNFPYIEFIINTYIYVPIIIANSCIGIYYIYKKNTSHNAFIGSLIVFGPILYSFSLLLVPTSGIELAQRSWGFFYIGLSMIISISFYHLTMPKIESKNIIRLKIKKLFVFFSILILAIGGISLGDKPIHREPDDLSPKLAAGAGSITSDIFIAAKWFKENVGINLKLLSSGGVGGVFRSYGSQRVEIWNGWRVFFPKTIDANVYNIIIGFNCIVVDNRISNCLAELGYYFSVHEIRKPYDIYGYGRTQPLPEICIRKFDQSNLLSPVYNNGNIRLYIVFK